MFKNNLEHIFPVLKNIYNVSELILVGADIEHWVKRTEVLSLEKICYINQSNSTHILHNLPKNWSVSSKVLSDKDNKVSFYKLSNPMLNGTVPSEVLVSLWKNLTTLEVESIEGVSLQNYIQNQCTNNTPKMLVIDTFDGITFLNDLKDLHIDVIALKIITTDESEKNRTNCSEQIVAQHLTNLGYKEITKYEDNHPKVATKIYVYDNSLQEHELSSRTKKLTTQVEQEKQKNSTLTKEIEEVKRKLDETHGYFLNRRKEAIETKEIVEQQKIEITNLKQKTMYSDDAKIDQFINDISPFFFKKSITYVDIGAFKGEVFMKINDIGSVNIREAHLFEPNPQSYEELQNNIQNYSISSLHTYKIGLGEKKGKVLFSSAKSMTKQCDDLNIGLSDTTNMFKAKIKPFDTFQNLITEGHIHLLKIDTEGKELNVFKGAKGWLEAEKIDVIYMEVGFNKSGTQQAYFCKLDKYLQQYGYRVFKFYEQTKEWIDDMPYLRRCNVAYISSKFAEANPYKLTLENHHLKKEIEQLKK